MFSSNFDAPCDSFVSFDCSKCERSGIIYMNSLRHISQHIRHYINKSQRGTVNTAKNIDKTEQQQWAKRQATKTYVTHHTIQKDANNIRVTTKQNDQRFASTHRHATIVASLPNCEIVSEQVSDLCIALALTTTLLNGDLCIRNKNTSRTQSMFLVGSVRRLQRESCTWNTNIEHA